MKKATAYPVIVTKGGALLGLGALTSTNPRSAVLLPGFPVQVFANRRRARRAIRRTQQSAVRLHGSLLADWPKLAPLFDPAPYTILRATINGGEGAT